MRDGKLIKARGYGLANVELEVPVAPRSIFQTGSVGKQWSKGVLDFRGDYTEDERVRGGLAGLHHEHLPLRP